MSRNYCTKCGTEVDQTTGGSICPHCGPTVTAVVGFVSPQPEFDGSALSARNIALHEVKGQLAEANEEIDRLGEYAETAKVEIERLERINKTTAIGFVGTMNEIEAWAKSQDIEFWSEDGFFAWADTVLTPALAIGRAIMRVKNLDEWHLRLTAVGTYYVSYIAGESSYRRVCDPADSIPAAVDAALEGNTNVTK